jgi:hypothetical protein
MANDVIGELLEVFKKDSSTKHPKFPGQSAFALKDERVINAIRRKLEGNATLTSVKLLEFDFFSGLNRIVFEFSSHREIGLKPSAILVIMDHASDVVGVVDPFDPIQPNPVLPALPAKAEQSLPLPGEESEMPFVLARPSGAKGLPFTEQDLFVFQVRSRSFFQGLGVGDLGGLSDGDTNSYASTLRSLIILAVPDNIDEPVAVTDVMNDDTCPL